MRENVLEVSERKSTRANLICGRREIEPFYLPSFLCAFLNLCDVRVRFARVNQQPAFAPVSVCANNNPRSQRPTISAAQTLTAEVVDSR
jgi:hypothetical protein